MKKLFSAVKQTFFQQKKNNAMPYQKKKYLCGLLYYILYIVWKVYKCK